MAGADTPSRGSTAAALIDAAEGLFAIDGFERASLRAVMRAAGADPGSVHYHFGGRPALAAAVLDRLLAPLNARRLALLDQARAITAITTTTAVGSGARIEEAADVEREGRAIPLPILVDALIRPDLEVAADLRSRGSGRSRLIGAIYLNPAAFVTERVEAHFEPVARRFQPELMAAVPGADPEVLAWRVRWIVFGTLGALLADPDEPFRRPIDELADRLAVDLAAALAAPPVNPSPSRRSPT